MARNLSFSYSKMGMYQECPQKYKFRYVHLLPEKPKYYFAFGSALHAVMEFIFDPQKITFPTLSQALVYFDKEWNKTSWEQKGYASQDKELAGYAEGRRIIETYYAQNSASFIHPLSVEMKSTLEVDSLSLISIVDRMDYLGDGRVKILDYKTGKTVQREPDQLYMYQKVVENSPLILNVVKRKDPSVSKVLVGELAFYHLPTLQELKFERASDNEIFTFWQKVLMVADHIRAGHFEPTPDENKCHWCDYHDLCPVYTGKEYTGKSAEKIGTALPTASKNKQSAPVLFQTEQDVLTDKIDRYGDLLEEAQQLKKEIIDLMKKNNFSRHFGSRYQAQLACVEKWEFTDHEKVVELLRTLKLLAKVLVPTQTTVANLLTDTTVSSAAKEQLRAFAQRKEIDDLKIEKTN